MTAILLATCRERIAFWEHVDSVEAASSFLIDKGIAVGKCFTHPTYIHLGREKLAEVLFSDPNFTHLCFIDSDNVLTPETIWRLLQHDKDIVGALYFKRVGSPQPVACEWVDDRRYLVRSPAHRVQRWFLDNNIEPAADAIDYDIDGLMEVDAIGFGCTLIKREVLEHIAPPRFSINDGGIMGEDVVFCKKAQDAGYRIWLDCATQIGHLTTTTVANAHFLGIETWLTEEEINGKQ